MDIKWHIIFKELNQQNVQISYRLNKFQFFMDKSPTCIVVLALVILRIWLWQIKNNEESQFLSILYKTGITE